MPAGPGARELTALFARIDTAITAPVPGDVKVHNSDRDILNLLSKQAATLHPGIANYCSPIPPGHYASSSPAPLFSASLRG